MSGYGVIIFYHSDIFNQSENITIPPKLPKKSCSLYMYFIYALVN